MGHSTAPNNGTVGFMTFENRTEPQRRFYDFRNPRRNAPYELHRNRTTPCTASYGAKNRYSNVYSTVCG